MRFRKRSVFSVGASDGVGPRPFGIGCRDVSAAARANLRRSMSSPPGKLVDATFLSPVFLPLATPRPARGASGEA